MFFFEVYNRLKIRAQLITGRVYPTDFIRGCSARGPDPLPFYILNFGNSGPFHILNVGNWHLFTYLSLKRHFFHILKRYPFHIPFPYLQPEKGTPFPYLRPALKRYFFRAELPRTVHYREYPPGLITACLSRRPI